MKKLNFKVQNPKTPAVRNDVEKNRSIRYS